MNISKNIAERISFYNFMDLRTLRSKYRAINEDMTQGMLMRTDRKVIARRLVAEELGLENVQKYFEQVTVWNEMRDFVEKGIQPST